MRSQDRFRGCLIGGAAGDALGYAVEFLDEEFIFRKYGGEGIRAYALSDGKALISDDTQMTLFTAAGLLAAKTRTRIRGIPEPYGKQIRKAYLNWLETQEGKFPIPENHRYSFLGNVPELFSCRAPGNACLAALHAGGAGTPEEPINQSKGCGGVMRVAPIGLYFSDRGEDIRDICRLGAEAAAMTHGHVLGWMPAAALVQIVYEISQNDETIERAVLHAIGTLEDMWPDTEDRRLLTGLLREAVDLAGQDVDDLDAIHELGEGWVAEETLAIAVYCAVKYPEDIDSALVAAVNHEGDSDSTGAVAGNIVGAHVGLSGIPSKYTETLEMRDLILEIADDLWTDCPEGRDPAWEQKYLPKAGPV